MERLFNLDAQLLFDACVMALSMLVMFTFLSYLLFKPVRKLLEDRKQRVADEQESAKNDRKEAAVYKEEYEQKLKEIDKEAQAILSEARKKAMKTENEIVAEAKEEAARIITRANNEIELERKRALDDMKQEMIAIASAMAGKVVAASIDTSVQDERNGRTDMAKLVSKVYGDALFEAARDCGKMDEIFEEVQSIGVILEENAELQKILGNPRVMREDKEQMIETIFRGRVSNEIVELMKLMIEKGRYSKIDSVFEYFIGLVKEEKKIGIAYIATAVELSEAQKEAVMQRLLQTTKYESFEMNYQVDASLIGGMVIRIGDRVVDTSIKTKLYELSKSLKKIQV